MESPPLRVWARFTHSLLMSEMRDSTSEIRLRKDHGFHTGALSLSFYPFINQSSLWRKPATILWWATWRDPHGKKRSLPTSENLETVNRHTEALGRGSPTQAWKWPQPQATLWLQPQEESAWITVRRSDSWPTETKFCRVFVFWFFLSSNTEHILNISRERQAQILKPTQIYLKTHTFKDKILLYLS